MCANTLVYPGILLQYHVYKINRRRILLPHDTYYYICMRSHYLVPRVISSLCLEL
jgi:hypothetical protein